MTMIQNRSEHNCVDRENKNLDELLATALTPDVQPERTLNEQILRRVKEEAQMKEEMNEEIKNNSGDGGSGSISIKPICIIKIINDNIEIISFDEG